MIGSHTFPMKLPGGGTAQLFDPARIIGLERWRAFVSSADARRSDPPVLEFRDVILHHGKGHWCLYDRDGHRIDASALVRHSWNAEAQMVQAPPTLPNPGEVQRTLDEPVVFCSVFFNHWGHFLLESMARLSSACAVPDMAGLPKIMLGVTAPPLPAIAEFFDALGGPPVDTGDAQRVRLRHCLLPPAAFATDGFADPRHLAALSQVARRWAGEAKGAAAPAYFSRTRIASPTPLHGPYVNKPAFEARLAGRGVEIIHMQELPLAEQVRVVNRRRAIIGLWGSALHNILFALDGSALSTFVLIRSAQRSANYLLVDSLVGNDAHYLATLRINTSGECEIDIEATLAYLDATGVFQ